MTRNEMIDLQNSFILGYVGSEQAIENVQRFYDEIKIEYPNIFIANKARSILGVIQCVSDVVIKLNLNDVNTISFTCQKYSNGIQNEYYEYIEDLMLIFVPSYGWFEITVEENGENGLWSKTVTGQAQQVELGQLYLRSFQANSTETYGDTEDEDYVKILFFNPADYKHSLLHKILKDTSWIVGHVDNSLWNKSRSFDIDSQDIYSFLTGDVTEAFNCIFQFDTFTKTINAFDLDDFGNDTSLYFDMDTIIKSIDISCDTNNIKTALYVEGGENIDIRDVNPNGSNKIYNFDYYKKYFSDDTRTAYETYVARLYELSVDADYSTLVTAIADKNSEILEIKYRLPDYDEEVAYDDMTEEEWDAYVEKNDLKNVTDWNACGVWLLETRLAILKTQEELFQEKPEMYCKADSTFYSEYEENHAFLVSCTEALNQRNSELANAEMELVQLKAQKKEITDALVIENYFTTEQWEEISSFIREDVYTNDSYMVLATDSNSYATEVAEELFNAASKELDKYCKPQYSFTTTIANLFKINAFSDVVKDFTIGNYIRLGVDGLISKLRLTSIEIDFETEDISVEYSDTIRTSYGYCDAASVQAMASSVASTVSFNKTQWDKGGTSSDYVENQQKNGIDVGKIGISSSDGDLQIQGDSILLKNGDNPKQSKWLKNQLIFTDDAWQTVKAALGEISFQDSLTGEQKTAYGLIADVIIGNLLLGEELIIKNDENTFIVSEDGIEISGKTENDTTTLVRINPNDAFNIISVIQAYGDSDNETTTFRVDKYGNVYMNATEITQNGNAIAAAQIEALSNNLVEIGATVTTLQGKVTTNETNISTLTSKVTTLETNTSSMSTKISNLETNVTSAKSDITSLTSKTTTLEKEVKELKENGVQKQKVEKELSMSTDENGRIINIKTTYEDGTYDNTVVEWNESGYLTKLGDLSIKWDF